MFAKNYSGCSRQLSLHVLKRTERARTSEALAIFQFITVLGRWNDVFLTCCKCRRTLPRKRKRGKYTELPLSISRGVRFWWCAPQNRWAIADAENIGTQFSSHLSWIQGSRSEMRMGVLIEVSLLLQNTTSREGQVKQLVYSMENAIANLPEDQEEMIWLVDFKNWSMTKPISIKTTQDAAHVLQRHYPERLGYGILINPPHIFETFWQVGSYILAQTCYIAVFVVPT